MSVHLREGCSDRLVLLIISLGLIVIVLGIVAGVFLTKRALPNWAENVLISIATASILKLGDCLAALLTLATGKSVERLGTQLAATAPAPDPVGKVTVEEGK
jgi:ABC-type phosphate transport system permease subunit